MKLGPRAEQSLRQMLTGDTSPEAEYRIRSVREHWSSAVVYDLQELRNIRAIRLLERIGTPGAQSVIEGLAKGAPMVYQTRHAKEALSRLRDRRSRS